MPEKSVQQHAIVSHGSSHQGKVRDHNEDAFLDLSSEQLWVVADGAGGHEKGEVASQLIIDSLSKFIRSDDLTSNVDWIVNELRSVNQKLIRMRDNLPKGGLIGSTVCVLFLHEGHVVCLWSGDSRIYLYRNRKLHLLSRDHNRIDEFLRAGFSEDELNGYSIAQQLTQAVGASSTLGVDVQLYEFIEEDRFLICSDGLTGELSHEEISGVFDRQSEVELTVNELISLVLKTRAGDNVTAVVINAPISE